MEKKLKNVTKSNQVNGYGYDFLKKLKMDFVVDPKKYVLSHELQSELNKYSETHNLKVGEKVPDNVLKEMITRIYAKTPDIDKIMKEFGF